MDDLYRKFQALRVRSRAENQRDRVDSLWRGLIDALASMADHGPGPGADLTAGEFRERIAKLACDYSFLCEQMVKGIPVEELGLRARVGPVSVDPSDL